MSTTTTNMLLTVPGVTTEPGPEYASQINGDLNIIDAHDHSTGKGVPVTPGGININANLPFNGNNAVTLRSTRFQAQGNPLTSTASSDIGCTYVAGVDLYYNDLSGNQIRLTQGGGVAGAAGSITNLVSPASAEYVSASSKFVWQSDSNIAADMDFRSAILRNSSAGSFGVTLMAPTLANNYSLTLPTIPGSTNFMTLDASGNMGATITVANGITRTMQAAVGQQVSSASGSYLQTSSAVMQVTGQSVSITTTGRPVMVMLQSASTAQSSIGTNGDARLWFYRDASAVAGHRITIPQYTTTATVGSSATAGDVIASLLDYSRMPASSFSFLDIVSAGTYTYTLRASAQNNALVVDSVNLIAWEL
jgi:hypothetical protein